MYRRHSLFPLRSFHATGEVKKGSLGGWEGRLEGELRGCVISVSISIISRN